MKYGDGNSVLKISHDGQKFNARQHTKQHLVSRWFIVKWIQRSAFSFKKKKLCDLIVYTNGSITKDKSAVHCRARPSLKMVLPLRHQSPAWQWNWKQLHMLSAGSPQKVKASPTCHHPHRSGEPATHWKVEWDDQASTWQCFVAILSIMEPRVG